MRLAIVMLLATCCSAMTGQQVLNLWEGESIPYYKESQVSEIEKPLWGTTAVLQVVKPTLTIYEAEGENSGTAVIVIPGGGYEAVAMYHEGYEVAEALAERGITAAVLKYRIPSPETSTDPEKVPLTDLRKAMKIMNSRAEELDFTSLGVLGFSAGSHLATVAGLWKSDHNYENPSFSGLIYGVTNIQEGNLKWIENNLYHRELSEEERRRNTLLDLVDESTPPAFLAHALDDSSCKVSETTLYAEKLREHQVLVESHVFSKGGHGFGLGSAETGTHVWVDLFVSWLRVNNL